MKYWPVVCVLTALVAFGCDGARPQSVSVADGGKDVADSTEEGSGDVGDKSPDVLNSDGATCFDQATDLTGGFEPDAQVSSVCPGQTPENGAACTGVGLCCSYANGQVEDNPACAGGEGGVVCKCKMTNTCGPTWECMIGV